MIAIRNILVATDFGEASDAALAYGRALATQFNATLHVIHVVENIVLRNVTADGFVGILPEVQLEVEAEARKELEKKLGAAGEPKPEALVLTSNAIADAVVGHAANTNADLIVIGTHGRHGVSRLLLGSVAERIVRSAQCPVLTVHHPEREFVQPDSPSAVVAA
jgi:nucleotide-binding universal stress UspA family protein